MSATIYKWIVIYDDGGTEERYGESPSDFVDYLVKVPVAIIRNGYKPAVSILPNAMTWNGGLN